ncbi:MAG TPA: aldo/keto reductase [Capsulimonadaceae bacterium]|jgi:aryl-alcohol dehydrogenase-like predicted oxidoreductase
MRYLSVDGIGFPTSVICLGCSPLGSTFDDDESQSILDTFAELGGNFLDTANCYADWIPGGSGASETTIGRWIRRNGNREKIVVATKGGHPHLSTMHIPRLRPEDIAEDLAVSLDRLNTNYVDLYWLHRDDPETPVGEIIDALNVHIDAGVIRAIGASNWLPSRLAAAATYASGNNQVTFVASQISWSLAAHPTHFDPIGGMAAMDDTSLEYYLASKLRVIPYSSQAGGFFARPIAEAEKRHPKFASAINRERHIRANTLARDLGHSPNSIVLAYILNNPASGCAVAGPHTPAQIIDTCGATQIELTASQMAYLEAAA